MSDPIRQKRAINSGPAGTPVLELTDSIILAGADIISALARDVQDSWLSAEEVAEKVFEAIIEASCSTPITSPQRALPSRLQRLSFQRKVFAVDGSRLGRDAI